MAGTANVVGSNPVSCFASCYFYGLHTVSEVNGRLKRHSYVIQNTANFAQYFQIKCDFFWKKGPKN